MINLKFIEIGIIIIIIFKKKRKRKISIRTTQNHYYILNHILLVSDRVVCKLTIFYLYNKLLIEILHTINIYIYIYLYTSYSQLKY